MKKKILIGILVLLALLAAVVYFMFRPVEIKVLVFSKTEEYRHESIEAGIAAIKNLGAQHGFTVEATEDSSSFNEDYLKNFQTIVFLNTTGDVLDQAQQIQMERFIQAGGGFVGVHAATDTEYGWPWYGKLVGAYFESHPLNPNVQEGELSIINANHQATDSLPALWKTADEWYNFKSINPDNQVLITIDESTYEEGTNGAYHPISWYKDYDGGRTFYTGMGHTMEQFSDSLFLNHLLGGLKYAIGVGVPVDYSLAYAEVVPEENRFNKQVFIQNLAEPMELDFLSENKIIFVERKGAVHIYDLEKGSDKTIAKLDVFSELEDGLLGVAVDPNYGENNWIYLYYSENRGADHQNLSRFELKNDSLDLASEKILLQVATQREECCHSGGSLEFGPEGNLFLSVGDNTNPHGSNGFAPIDERSGRFPWDAQKSSANTNDLRGKILRIKPEADGTYSIPEGNLFTNNEEKGRPEIYIMGNRNPFRIAIDSRTGYLYWGEVGPDASKDSIAVGIKGYDEINQAKTAGNFGWPYFIADNKAYNDFNFTTNTAGAVFDSLAPINDSPNNTGMSQLPPAQPAMIYYPYGASEEFPALGTGARNAMAGPIYYSEDYPDSGRNFPDYFDGKPLIYDWMRGWIFAASLHTDGSLEKLTQIVPNMDFHNIIDMAFGPDGALYILEYGTGWFSQNVDATLSRIDFISGNRVPVPNITLDKAIGADPLTVKFSGRNSIDYDGDTLTYKWTFGEGGEESTESDPTYTFTESGKYKVTLTIVDEQGNSASGETEILVGNELPELSWEITEGNSSFYWPNRPVSISYEVRVSDAEDGNLADGSLDASRVAVSFDYLAQGSDKVLAAKDHAQMADEAYASIGKNLVNNTDCIACHKEKDKSIGPSYLDISQRYAQDESAPEMLVGKIINGGGGNWGETAMAAHPDLNPAEAKQMVEYILSLSENAKPAVSKYPTKGKYTNREHMDTDTKGTYILTASYTDLGGGKIEPLSAKQSFILRYPKLEGEDFDEGSSNKMNIKAGSAPGLEEDMGIAIGQKDAYFMFKDLDLTGVTGVKGRFAVAKGIMKGGDIELRLGAKEGELIGKFVIKVGLTDFGMKEFVLELEQPIKGKNDLYFVFKSQDEEASAVVTAVDWVEFLSAQ